MIVQFRKLLDHSYSVLKIIPTHIEMKLRYTNSLTQVLYYFFKCFVCCFSGVLEKSLNHTAWLTGDVETTKTGYSRLEATLPLLSAGVGAAVQACKF